MPEYTPTTWEDRLVEKPRTFTVTNNPDGTITLTPAPGVVLDEGTAVNAAVMNSLEQRAYKAYEQSESMYLTDEAERHYTYDGDDMVKREDFVEAVLRRETTYVYTDGNITGKTVKLFDTDGVTVLKQYTDIITYTGDEITNMARDVS